MPRPLRIELEGAICHPPSCTATAGQASCIGGDRREPIFGDDADRRRFLDTLGEACAKTDGQESAEAQAEGLVRIARRLRAETTMTLAWIARRLQMGVGTHGSNLLASRP